MNPDEYRRMYELEDHYWWFVARRSLALRMLRRYAPAHVRPLILDVGCGTGAVSRALLRWADPIGADMSDLALRMAQSRGDFGLTQADGTALPFASDSFDACVGLDVFEHIENDQLAVSECARALRPGGVLVLSVPAFKSLWGPHDVALHHFRRYRLKEVEGLLRSAGLQPIRISYSVFFLFPVVVMVRWFEKRRKGEAHASLPAVPNWLNKALIALGEVEGWLVTRVPLPWGSSVVAVARKP